MKQRFHYHYHYHYRYHSKSLKFRYRCRKNLLFRKCSKSHMKTQQHLRSNGLNMAFQKKALVLPNIAIVDHEASRGPHMSYWRQHAYESKMSKFAFRKNTFCKKKLKTNSANMHLNLHTATPERNSSLFVRCQIYENQWFYIVISPSTGLWEMHFCSMVQTKPHYGSPKKTHMKP